MFSMGMITGLRPQMSYHLTPDIAAIGAAHYTAPYRHKCRKALTNFRSGNKKKLRQFVK
jgi:hypothetical protein